MSDALLRTRWLTFGFHETVGIPRPAASPAASHDSLSFMEEANTIPATHIWRLKFVLYAYQIQSHKSCGHTSEGNIAVYSAFQVLTILSSNMYFFTRIGYPSTQYEITVTIRHQSERHAREAIKFKVKNDVFWDVMPRSSCEDWRFRGNVSPPSSGWRESASWGQR
jgi:hypothetical protein